MIPSIVQDKIECDELISVNSALQVAMNGKPNYIMNGGSRSSRDDKNKETIDTSETKTDEVAVEENTVVAQPRFQGQRRSQIRKSNTGHVRERRFRREEADSERRDYSKTESPRTIYGSVFIDLDAKAAD